MQDLERKCSVLCADHGLQHAKLRPRCATCKGGFIQLTETHLGFADLKNDQPCECFVCPVPDQTARFITRCGESRCEQSPQLLVDVYPDMQTEAESYCMVCTCPHDDASVRFPCGHWLGLSCIPGWLTNQIFVNRLLKLNPVDGVFSIVCAHSVDEPECEQSFLPDVLVVKACDPSDRERRLWVQFKELQTEMMIAHQRWLYCPKCHHALEPDDPRRDGTAENIMCPNPHCRHWFCLNCERDAHQGRCLLAAMETRSPCGRYVMTRTCRGCMRPFQHPQDLTTDEYACHHMTCDNCGTEICYNCGEKWVRYPCPNGCPIFCVEGECVCPPPTAAE
eukprot:TRINITY_DN13569_c0_g1_i1.p1 TRINITY_DN13569_c0_g1~~TRINITY_DN13569_c0_g1_i1.p1  ORF type:complete len:335 (+),score=12.26 TRINITY_DN13569_c0_g1_i1:31-1035(+)